MFIFCLIIVFGIIGFMKWNQQGKTVNNGPVGSYLSVDNSFYDFGTISMAKGKVRTVFSLKNTTAETIVVEKLYTSCMCTSATLEINGERKGPFGMPSHKAIPKINQQITPGTKAFVEVEFDPAAHGPAGVGKIERKVFLDILSQGKQGKQEFSFSANVTP